MRLSDLALVGLLPLLATARVELDPATHHHLLLSGRPQIGLWQSLLKQAEVEAASSDLMYAYLSRKHTPTN